MAQTMWAGQTFSSGKQGGIYLNKAKLIVTRVFDSERTPQDAFVRAILNSDKYEKTLQVPGSESIIEGRGLICIQPDSDEEGRTR